MAKWLHYDGADIQLQDDADIDVVTQQILRDTTPGGGWLNLTAKDGAVHRLWLTDGVALRFSETFAAAKPRRTSRRVITTSGGF